MGYDTEKGAKEIIYSGKASAALLTPIVSKEEIVKTALAGEVFPKKRHVIPARPMFRSNGYVAS